MRAADLAIEHGIVPVDQESGGIGCFLLRVPAQSIQVCELVVGIDDETDVGGQGILFGKELFNLKSAA